MSNFLDCSPNAVSVCLHRADSWRSDLCMPSSGNRFLISRTSSDRLLSCRLDIASGQPHPSRPSGLRRAKPGVAASAPAGSYSRPSPSGERPAPRLLPPGRTQPPNGPGKASSKQPAAAPSPPAAKLPPLPKGPVRMTPPLPPGTDSLKVPIKPQPAKPAPAKRPAAQAPAAAPAKAAPAPAPKPTARQYGLANSTSGGPAAGARSVPALQCPMPQVTPQSTTLIHLHKLPQQPADAHSRQCRGGAKPHTAESESRPRWLDRLEFNALPPPAALRHVSEMCVLCFRCSR